MRPSEALERHREEVRTVLAGFRIKRPMVFGSVARGEDVEGSDLDILVELEPSVSYYEVFRIEDALSALLGVKVDVYTPGQPSSRFMQTIERDLKAV